MKYRAANMKHCADTQLREVMENAAGVCSGQMEKSAIRWAELMGILSWLRLGKTRFPSVQNCLSFCPQSVNTSALVPVLPQEDFTTTYRTHLSACKSLKLLVNSPRLIPSVREWRSVPLSPPPDAKIPCYLSHSRLHLKKLNRRSEEIRSSSPTSYPELMLIKVRYSLTFMGHPFCSLSAPLNTKQVTYGLCQLHCKSFVPFNENIAGVFFLSPLEPSRISVINGACWWRNASARPTTAQGHCADPKLQPGVVSTGFMEIQWMTPYPSNTQGVGFNGPCGSLPAQNGAFCSTVRSWEMKTRVRKES